MRHEAWTAGRVTRALRRQPIIGGSVVVLLLTGALSVAIGTAVGLSSFRDVGYPDSATLLRIGEFARSGQIYPDGNQPPYLISLYGPLTYVSLALPYRLAPAAGIAPQILVRLAVLGALCLCVLLIFEISRRLYNSRKTAWLCTLFAVSTFPLADWTTQIRGDFLALALSLFSVYWFLLMNGRPLAIGAATCAGIALLVKPTFIAAPIAIVSWLICRRRYKEAVFCATGVALIVAGGYTVVWWREPPILKNTAAPPPPLFEYRQALDILWEAVSQPVSLFGVIGGFLVFWKRAPEDLFFLIYYVVAWLVAILTIPQVGGDINYFWEPFLVSAVLAGSGLCELQRRAHRTPIMVTAMLFVLLVRSFLPMLRDELGYLKKRSENVRDYQARKTKWESFVSTISGRRLLSTIPDVAVHSTIPEIPDPILNSVLELRGQWDSGPVVAHINESVYDLIVVWKGQAETDKVVGYRGVRRWDDAMWGALKKTYRPSCVFDDLEVWLPNRGTSQILSSLTAIGCLPAKKQVDGGSAVALHAK